MLGPVIASVLVLAAPEEVDAEKLLRIAWASQYEWTEDKVESVALDFTWSTSWKGKEGNESKEQGHGHVLIVGEEVARRHYPGASSTNRDQANGYLDRTLARFMRKPFEERFKDAEIEPDGQSEDGARRISVDGWVCFVKGDRLVGHEMAWYEGEERITVPVAYTVATMGGGYGVLEERYEYVRESGKTTNIETLVLRKDSPIPAPAEYRRITVSPESRWEVRVVFDPPRFNAENAVVIEPEARDLLEEAWATRYTLPNEIRIEAKFEREIDRGLAKAGWWKRVEGELQVWGMDQITMALDEDTVRRRRWVDRLEETVDGHIRGFFESLRTRPFEEEFEHCGFRRIGETDEGVEIEVVGHPTARGFRVEEGRVVGHLSLLGPDDGWFEYKLKKAKDGRFLIDRMVRRVERERFHLEFSWARSRGCHVPKRFSVFIEPGADRSGNRSVFGVVEYKLLRTKVSFP